MFNTDIALPDRRLSRVLKNHGEEKMKDEKGNTFFVT
jgi:hypothetical protein